MQIDGFILVMTVTFRPDGGQIAIATLNAQISFYDPNTANPWEALRVDMILGTQEQKGKK